LIQWALPWLLLLSLVRFGTPERRWWLIAGVILLASRNFIRLRRANFDAAMEFLAAFFGMPMFAYLLLRSKRMHVKGSVGWKGRTYVGRRHTTNDSPRANIHRKTMMKTTVILLISFLFLAANSAISHAPVPQITEEPHFSNVIIEPGVGVGPLKLGDPRAQALALFPKKAEDQEWTDPCGITLDWVDTFNPNGRGDVLIRLKKGKIFQIESSTTRFHTADGITTFDSPEKVATAYKGMSAGVLLTPPVPALGDRPLVFWIDRKRGIAFALAYDPSHRKRYIYKVIVFESNKEFCPEQEKTTSPKWQNIRPYSIEPPIELSPEPQ
jgi:hypothetical protein